jgi:hypothetical protein
MTSALDDPDFMERVVLDVLDVASRHPDLTSAGWQEEPPAPLSWLRATGGNFYEQVASAIIFLQRCETIAKATTANYGSYSIKHVVERWARKNGLPGYCGNGALVFAALIMGVPVKRDGKSTNCGIGISSKAMKALALDA